LAGALTFGASLNHLLNTPRLYGWKWDAHVTTNSDQPSADPAVDALQSDPAVEDVATVDTPPVLLDGRVRFDIIALDQKKGLLDPIVLDGRAPRAPNEIALGVKTLHDVHAHIGSTVRLLIAAITGSRDTPFTVVGTVVIPPNSDTARLGSGAVITYAAVKRMAPPDFKHLPQQTDLYFRFAPGVNKAKEMAAVGKLPVVNTNGKGTTALENDYQIILPQRPTDLVNFGQVQNLPFLLAGLVTVLAAATLAHTLVTSIRRRKHGNRRHSPRTRWVERVRKQSGHAARTGDAVAATAPDHPRRDRASEPDRSHPRADGGAYEAGTRFARRVAPRTGIAHPGVESVLISLREAHDQDARTAFRHRDACVGADPGARANPTLGVAAGAAERHSAEADRHAEHVPLHPDVRRRGR
jgi:hypothetical protein